MDSRVIFEALYRLIGVDALSIIFKRLYDGGKEYFPGQRAMVEAEIIRRAEGSPGIGAWNAKKAAAKYAELQPPIQGYEDQV